jgi:hypothetical protein
MASKGKTSRTKSRRSSMKEISLFIDVPSYKLWAEKDIVRDFLGRGYVRYSGTSPLEVIYQALVIVRVLLLWKIGLHQAKIKP